MKLFLVAVVISLFTLQGKILFISPACEKTHPQSPSAREKAPPAPLLSCERSPALTSRLGGVTYKLLFHEWKGSLSPPTKWEGIEERVIKPPPVPPCWICSFAPSTINIRSAKRTAGGDGTSHTLLLHFDGKS